MTTSIAVAQKGERPTGRRRPLGDHLRRHRGQLVLAQIAVLVLILALYSIVVVLLPNGARFLPTVPALVGGFGTILTDPMFWSALGSTCFAAAIGLVISLVIGAVAGMLLATHRRAYLSAQFVVDFMRTIPALALIPVGLLLMGPTLRMEITLIVVTAVWPALIQMRFGVINIDPKLLEAARSFRIPAWRRLVFIVAPAVGPSFATAVRLCATLCLLLAVGTELLAVGSGLGYLVGWYQEATRVPEMYATVIVIGLLGVAINALVLLAEARLFAWHRRETRGDRR